jgi:type I restriction enzyme S subunit
MSNKAQAKTMKQGLKRESEPKLRFPEFRDAEGWESKRLGELFFDRQESGLSGLPLLSLMDKEGIVPQENSNRKNNSNSDKSKYLRVVPGDIAYNTMRMWEGRSAYVGLEGLVSPAYTVCQPKAEVHSLLFSYYFKTPQLIEQFRRYSQGLVNDTLNLKYEAFSTIAVLAPTFPEQQKIADCLSSVDELIDANRLTLDTLKAHKKGLMRQLFPREGETIPCLRFPEFINEQEWEEDKLGNLVEITSGESPSRYNLSVEGKYAFLKVEDLNNCEKYQITSREYSDDTRNLIPRRSIIFPKRGAAIHLNKLRINVSEVLMDTNLMAISPNNNVETEFVYYYIANIGLSQIADTSTIPQINNKHIIPFKVVIPLKSEQQRIANCFSALEELIAAQTQQLDALKTHKEGLMQELFPPAEEVNA